MGHLTVANHAAYSEVVMQLSFNNGYAFSLSDLLEGQSGILTSLDLPEDFARRLMELGFLPGMEVTAAKSAPSGDPRVFRVDGAEIALRRETAGKLLLQGSTPNSHPTALGGNC